MTTPPDATAAPLVAVLMATHDGAAFVEEQARSILGQRDVRVRLVVSDDASTDGTPLLLERLAADERVTVLPPGSFGTPQANFLRLMREADVDGAVAVALADQDDVWHDDKLSRQLALLERLDVDAVSSNVVAFWEKEDGSRSTELIDKAQPQTPLDFLLESAGPGCTFLIDAEAFAAIRDAIRQPPHGSARIDDSAVPHDWLAYAIVRASGGRWHIDAEPTLDYRQHDANATGANTGLAQAAVRFRRLASGEYRQQCGAVARLSASVADDAQRPRLERIAPLFDGTDLGSRMALHRLAPELRREATERRLLRIALVLGFW
ncbi:glycosyltransferase [Agrococcus sediminis]|uniref:glycosyltransferase n=1 Tax=Agrococcus sediminis TaxID=2599924 RepID=UPI003431E59A